VQLTSRPSRLGLRNTLAYVYKAGAPAIAFLLLGGRVLCLTVRTGVLAAKFADAYKHETRAHLFDQGTG
jgi:hypothetical protein